MGGNAFNADHPEASFPRMHPSVYEKVKAKVHDILKPLYDHVTSPAEAPQKADHGDIDFIVCSPRVDMTPDDLQKALGAIWSIPRKGTSHFALPWDTTVGHHTNDEAGRQQDFIQVDIYVCEDIALYERASFCHSYGDLFMILGLMARGIGLSLGTSGVKVSLSTIATSGS